MYHRKIWRENRVRFVALLILGLVTGVSVRPQVRLDALADYQVGQVFTVEVASRLWGHGMDLLRMVGGVTLYCIGLIVGAGGLGEEMERGSATFLLSRPRSRGYFVWSFWLACVLELTAFALLTMLSGYATLFYLIRRPGPSSFLLLAPILMITGLLGVGLASLLATGSRSGKNAAAGGLAFTMAYLAMAFAADYYHKHHSISFRLPTPLDLDIGNWNAAFAGTMLGWLALSVVLVAVSHWIVMRMEV